MMTGSTQLMTVLQEYGSAAKSGLKSPSHKQSQTTVHLGFGRARRKEDRRKLPKNWTQEDNRSCKRWWWERKQEKQPRCWMLQSYKPNLKRKDLSTVHQESGCVRKNHDHRRTRNNLGKIYYLRLWMSRYKWPYNALVWMNDILKWLCIKQKSIVARSIDNPIPTQVV